jgi:hypothetical protein
MPFPKTFEIAARVDHLSKGVGCLDPIRVVARMRVAFPELVENSRDCLWEACDYFRKSTHEGSGGALRTAVRDMQERGPQIIFSIPLPDGQSIGGVAERYWVRVTSSEEFPEDFRRRFTEFLHGLSLQPIQIT